jgi:hypothetical protein
MLGLAFFTPHKGSEQDITAYKKMERLGWRIQPLRRFNYLFMRASLPGITTR